MNTERRIEALEQRCRRLTAALLAIGLIAGLAVFVAAAPSERDLEVRKLICRELVVMDEKQTAWMRPHALSFFLAGDLLAGIGVQGTTDPHGSVLVQSKDRKRTKCIYPENH